MQFPHRLLQIGTLALFSSMISGLVLFQSGTFKPEQPLVEPDSLVPPTWLDSATLSSTLLYIHQLRVKQEHWLTSSKASPVFSLPSVSIEPPKKKGRRSKANPVHTPTQRDTASAAQRTLVPVAWHRELSRLDTQTAINVLRMRYEVARFHTPDSLKFGKRFQLIQRQSRRQEQWLSTLPTPIQDSITAWEQLRYGPAQVAALSSSDRIRYQTILDSLLRPRMMSSKSGLVFPQRADSTEALKILTAEKRRR
jgi:hypothetical protein